MLAGWLAGGMGGSVEGLLVSWVIIPDKFSFFVLILHFDEVWCHIQQSVMVRVCECWSATHTNIRFNKQRGKLYTNNALTFLSFSVSLIHTHTQRSTYTHIHTRTHTS